MDVAMPLVLVRWMVQRISMQRISMHIVPSVLGRNGDPRGHLRDQTLCTCHPAAAHKLVSCGDTTLPG
eukprot:CAMPEP_0179415232 /NCGR_PEP_ID=MMETSP0799-20121207/6116_1 /TAXON_ID=46947 /ORGANISM="Geminigera cryophila, Strain CCMP2564" /LENGTH=67 /DNA_ID=CAMNT_0021187945 /DNA_START=173 /DNA_END=376 /DNA_ORIENTATION=-